MTKQKLQLQYRTELLCKQEVRIGEHQQLKVIETDRWSYDLLDMVSELGRREFIALYSGGQDSIVNLHMHQESVKKVFAINTTINAPEWEGFVKDTCQRFGWPLEILRRKDRKTFVDFVHSYGFPQQGAHWLVMRYLKIRPLEDWYREHKDLKPAFLSGVREKESKQRFVNVKPIQHYKKNGLWFVAPIHPMSDKERTDYIKRYELPISPTYTTMHFDGNCWCGAFAPRAEKYMLQMFQPTVAEEINMLEQWCKANKMKYKYWGNAPTKLHDASLQEMEGQYRFTATEQCMETTLCAGCNMASR